MHQPALRQPMHSSLAMLCIVASIGWLISFVAWAEDGAYPKYKPSARSPVPLDIRTNVYGASNSAPDALRIAEVVPNFTLPKAGGGQIRLKTLLADGPVALIFYRGHW